MNTTITIGDAILILMGICSIIILIYIIRVLRNLLPVIKALQAILEDTQTVTKIVSNATINVEDTFTSLSESSSEMADFIHDNQNSFKAIVSLVNAVVSIKKLLC